MTICHVSTTQTTNKVIESLRGYIYPDSDSRRIMKLIVLKGCNFIVIFKTFYNDAVYLITYHRGTGKGEKIDRNYE